MKCIFLRTRTLFLSAICCCIPFASLLAEPEQSDEKARLGMFNADFNEKPTYIKADTLTLKAKDRFFTYSGNVEVEQDDMLLTADLLEGTYTEDNQIDQLVAIKNVVITKGENIRATGQRAIYTAKTETITLTENPELLQEGSVLTADSITVFLAEDRSVAEGDVRVKLIEKEEKKKDGAEAAAPGKKKKKKGLVP